ncbi:protein-export chaperone SecB [Sphingomonas sp.]|uniref:protein-export chaperone SecB n=1 Tax=Sphingomonas sp. TaxID=28214 RepID=UPI0025D57FEE|nr:protein-export chaperone SecB [Sphingomonas sp.]
MADEQTPATTPDTAPQIDDDLPQAATIAQYIKDLSVENPNAPAVYQWGVQPLLDVQFNIAINKITDDVHEVALKIEVSAKSNEGTHFHVDLAYGGVFAFRNLPEEALPPFLLVEAPRLLFPFARQIVADAVQNTGFPPLLLDPIDFGAAYMAQVEAANAGQEPNGHAAPDGFQPTDLGQA